MCVVYAYFCVSVTRCGFYESQLFLVKLRFKFEMRLCGICPSNILKLLELLFDWQNDVSRWTNYKPNYAVQVLLEYLLRKGLKKVKVTNSAQWYSHDKAVTPAIWDHSVTCYRAQVNVPFSNPGRQAGTWFTYLGGMEGWVDLHYPAIVRKCVQKWKF